jgi:hypothetical protein
MVADTNTTFEGIDDKTFHEMIALIKYHGWQDFEATNGSRGVVVHIPHVDQIISPELDVHRSSD